MADNVCVLRGVCVCVCVCVRARVCVVHACMHVCLCVGACRVCVHIPIMCIKISKDTN